MTPADLRRQIAVDRHYRRCAHLADKRGRDWLPPHPHAGEIKPGDVILYFTNTPLEHSHE